MKGELRYVEHTFLYAFGNHTFCRHDAACTSSAERYSDRCDGVVRRSVPFVYASFVIMVFLGLLIRCRLAPLTVGGAALAGSVQFFIITNFGVWLVSDLYPKTAAGLVNCYVAAIPFFRNMLVGNAFYTLVLFGGFALAQRYIPVLRQDPVTVTTLS